MRIRSIAMANLRRRKGKALFLCAGIAIGIGTVVALFSLSRAIRDEIGAQLDRFGANIVMVPRSNTLALDYGGIAVSGVAFDVQSLTDEDARAVADIPYRKRLSVVAPKLLGAVDTEAGQALLAGVDFNSELRLKRWWRLIGEAPKQSGEAVLGYEAARALGAVRTEHVHAAGGGHHAAAGEKHSIARERVRIAGREHRVAGILAPTGGQEDRMIFAPLGEVQRLLGRPGELSVVEVSALCKDCPVEDIVAQIARRVPHAKVSAVQQAVRARTEMVERLARFSAVVSTIVLAIAALLIFTTMMGAVVERTKEIGVLRAIGFRRTHIAQELMLEVAAISVAGGLLGWTLGMAASWAALPYFTETGPRPEIRATLALAAVCGAILVGAASSVYPVMRASRLDPSEAVRQI